MYYRDSIKMAAESQFVRVNTERSREGNFGQAPVATPAVDVVRRRALQAAEYYHKKVRSSSMSSGSGTEMAASGDTYQMNSLPGSSTSVKHCLDLSDASETDALRAGVTPASSDTYYKQKLRAGFIDLRNSYNEKIRTRTAKNLGHRTFTTPAKFDSQSSTHSGSVSARKQISGSPARRKRSGDRGYGSRSTRSDRPGLHRSNSSLELEQGKQQFLLQDVSVPLGKLKRDYGSANSLDIMSNSGESFFAMLQDYHNENVDQRAAAPPQMTELLRGHLDKKTNVVVSNRSSYPQSRKVMNGTAVSLPDAVIEQSSPKTSTKAQKTKERRPRAKTMVAEAGSEILRKIRGARSDAAANKSMSDNSPDDGRPEDRLRRKAFIHFDCQSISVVMGDVIKRRTTKEMTRRNTTTGASAARDDADADDTDVGDGKSNDLLLSCPFFRNEIGGEEEHMICLNRVTAHKRSQQLLGDREWSGESLLRPAVCNGVTLLDTSQSVHGTAIPSVVNHRGLVVEHVDHGAAYYRTFLHGFDHQNLFGIDDNLGPVAVSIKREKVVDEWENEGSGGKTEGSGGKTEGSGGKSEGGSGGTGYFQYRIIVRTPELTTLRGSVVEDVIPSTSRLSSTRGLPSKEILDFVVPELNTSCLRQALTGAKTCEQLMKVDEQGVTKNYKIGVMYCREGQSSEEEMYNNEWSSPAFEEFLSCMGKKVTLKGFDQYRGGLDCKTDSTGNHSLYTDFHGYGIMFHVSTMLPYTPNNKQQLLRKRHIGNDIVTIVFQEPGAEPFTPKTVRSHFQHVFIIVRAHNPNTDHVKYSMSLTRSKDVPTFGPAIPEGPAFRNSTEFKEFLLTKAINGENAVHKSEKFTAMAIRTRQEYLKDLATNYVTTSSLESGSKFGKFSLGSGRKKEKTRSRNVPDSHAKGGLVWVVQVEDFGRSCAMKSYLSIGPETIVVLDEMTKEVVFSSSCKSVIGWTATNNSMRLYYDQGECVALRAYQSDVDEIQEVVTRLTTVTDGCETTEMTLRRNDVGQLGFHIHYDGIVSDVEPYGFAWQAGLRQGSRLVEICKVATATLSHDQMIDLLRTSVPVTVVVIPPFEDGTPRRGFEDQWPCYSAFNSRYPSTSSSVFDHSQDDDLPVSLPPRAGRALTPGPSTANRGELQQTSLSRYHPASHHADLKGVTVNLEAHFSQLPPQHTVQSSQESIGSRSSGQGSEQLSSEGPKSDGYVSVEEKQPSAGRPGVKDYEGHVNPNWSGRVTIYPAYSKDSQLSHGSLSPRADSAHTHWYDHPPINPSLSVPANPSNPPLPYHGRAGYLSQHPFTPMTRKAVSNSSLASPHPYSVYHSDVETRLTRTEPGPSSLVNLGPAGEWARRNSPKRQGRGVVIGERDDTPLSRYRLEAVSPAGRRRQLAFSVHKTRHHDVTSPHNSNTSSPGGSLNRGVTSALSDENISGGRHNAGKGVGDASSHRHNDAGSKSSTFQEDLMRLINPDSTFSEKEQTPKCDAPQSRTSSTTNGHLKFKGRPIRLQRTLSDESIIGANKHRDPNDAIPECMTGSVREHFFSDPRLSPRVIPDRSCLRMNGTSRQPASPILPLPDSAGIDWTNLVDAARAFEGSEADIVMKQGNRTNTAEPHNSIDRRRGSNSHLSDTPHPGQPPLLPVRASASTTRPSDGGWRSGRSNPADRSNPGERIEELESRLSQVEKELERERSEKSVLQTQVQQVQLVNVQLQEESQKAATQLRQFTEWFFNTIDRQ